jgi:hypothetical protein
METEAELRSARYELKLELEGSMLPTARAWTRLHPAGFYETYPPRRVNNIYFDTHRLDSYNDHMEGVPERRKLRFRWYGEDLRHACGQLELKEKNERTGWKLVHPVEDVLDLERCDWADAQRVILGSLSNGDGRLFREMLGVSRPLVINSYQREYYLSADGLVRLTLDYDQRVYDQWLAARPNLSFVVPSLNKMLIELKAEVAHARSLADVLARFPVRASRHSKFISAIDLIFER